jgi:hypothetical protein
MHGKSVSAEWVKCQKPWTHVTHFQFSTCYLYEYYAVSYIALLNSFKSEMIIGL